MINSTITGNYDGIVLDKPDGYADSRLTLIDSTISGNADFGVDFEGGGAATLVNSTVSNNLAGLWFSGGGAATLVNTLLAAAPAGNCHGNGPASIDASSHHNLADDATCGLPANQHNLSSTPAGLDPAGLRDNGGPTKTVALQAGSAALDAGDDPTCAASGIGKVNGVDQRGVSRTTNAGAHCDIGAYEARRLPLTTGTTGTGAGTVAPSGTNSYLEGQQVSVSATAANGSVFSGWTVDNVAAGSTTPLSVTMDAAHTVTASFSIPAPSPSPSPSPSALPSPSPSPTPQVTLTVSTAGTGTGMATPLGSASHNQGSVVTLTATPDAGNFFAGWSLDGTLVSWAAAVTLTMDASHTVVATFKPLLTFGDVPAGQPFTAPVQQLAARAIINGCQPTAVPPLFCPTDPTLRHQMAALIVRAIPGWVDETGLPTFSDNTDDTELMTRVATLQRHNVVRGYQDTVCVERNLTPPCYGPLDTVKYGQVLLFIARAMVEKGYWTLQPDDRSIFPDQNGAVGADPDTDQQTRDHRMVVTYTHYVGNPPDVTDIHAPFQVAGVARGGWADASSRGWFARAFWPALNSYFGQDNLP